MDQDLLKGICEDAIKQTEAMAAKARALVQTVMHLTQLIRAADQCALLADKNSQEALELVAQLQTSEAELRQVHQILQGLPNESTLDAAKRVMRIT